jgi:tRNA nucleotidyltransferase/poly(A) polymerase
MEIFLVGGAVRDQLLGLTPKDFDWVIVGATQLDVDKMLIEGYEQVGADFPVFLHPTSGEEYALARVERKTGVGYTEFSVIADSSVTLKQDLIRRDFTINSMAKSSNGTVIDPYGGIKDLQNKILRHTSEAFTEDPLRVLRLARFAARYDGFSIAPETIELCKLVCASGELNAISEHRIWVELQKGFSTGRPDKFIEVLHLTGALSGSKVLSSALGTSVGMREIEICKALSIVMPSVQLAAGVAVLNLNSNEKQTEHTPKQILDCVQNLKLVRHSKNSATGLADVLRKCGALKEGNTFSDLCYAIAVLEQSGIENKLVFTCQELILAQSVMSSVRANQFPDFTGKELGDKIAARRVQNLYTIFGIKLN